MKMPLNPVQQELIHQLVTQKQPELLTELSSDAAWSPSLRDALTRLVGDELVAVGFDENYGLTSKGAELQAIIDYLADAPNE